MNKNVMAACGKGDRYCRLKTVSENDPERFSLSKYSVRKRDGYMTLEEGI